jgi:Mn-containing catalase
MLPIPNLPDADFKEARPFVDRGLHARLYRFSPDDFKDISAVWHGEHPIDGTPLEVVDGLPEHAADGPYDPPEEPAVFAPGIDPGELAEIAQRLMNRV